MKCKHELITPETLKKFLPLSTQHASHIEHSRQTIINIINRQDPRFLIVCGPCSIHDPHAALEYAVRLKLLAEKLQNELYIIMRVYFEKPRTTVGWKGFINDPYHNNSFNIEEGLRLARSLLMKICSLNLPAAMEALDPVVPNYLGDLISWIAIGARTTESQIHRELASNLSMPVGFKNGTDGNINIAINAMKSSALKHHFIGVNQQGQSCVIESRGNPNSHLILRGGITPNYDSKTIAYVEQQLKQNSLSKSIIVDCSHKNCNDDYFQQIDVAKSIANQLCNGNESIIGIMLESHLNEGSQGAYLPPNESRYGVSITDGCIGWQDTEKLLVELAAKINKPSRKRLKKIQFLRCNLNINNFSNPPQKSFYRVMRYKK